MSAHKWLGDIVIVEWIEKCNIHSTSLIIPETTRNKLAGIQAKVIGLGYIPTERRKKKRYYPCDDLTIGDTVIVPEHLGSRNRLEDNQDAIIYDGEDVLAKIEI